MWGVKEGICIAVYEDKRKHVFLGPIAKSRIINIKELPHSFEIRKVYFKTMKGDSNWGGRFFTDILNINGSPFIECIYIEVKNN